MKDLPILETERLVLRVPCPTDAVEMADFATRNREHFAPWDPQRSDDYYTVDHWRIALDEVVENAISGRSVQFVLLPRQGHRASILGQCTLSGIVRGAFQAAYLGYGLSHESVGRGLMTEALRSVIHHCFDDLRLHRIMANYMPTNERSATLLRRLGFVPEGYARDYLFLAGKWQDHVLTALTNPRWEEV